MLVQASFARYRLMYRYPFGTAHGVRDGTDAVYLKLEQDGHIGYGEATMPPYLGETQEALIDTLYTIDLQGVIGSFLKSFHGAGSRTIPPLRPAVRNLIQMAVADLVANKKGIPVSELLLGKGAPGPSKGSTALFTIGHGPLQDIPLKIKDMPPGTSLKIKIGGTQDEALLDQVMECSEARLFLDGNQGCASVDQVLSLIERIGSDRILGIEQPFCKEAFGLHRRLRDRTDVPVYADESLQDSHDLDDAMKAFDGVNIKLMKCGGLDTAYDLITRSREIGLKVMLGCMSEGAVGCAAMAHLAGLADLVDLDGPWLLSNDPFEGMEMNDGQLRLKGASGIGVVPARVLEFVHIGA